jgi:hypothetical protein
MLDEEFLCSVTSFELVNSIRNGCISPDTAKSIPVLVGGSVSFSVTDDGISLRQSKIPASVWFNDIREILQFSGEVTLICFEENSETKKKMKKSRSSGDRTAMVPFLSPYWTTHICRSEDDVRKFLKMHNNRAYQYLFKDDDGCCMCLRYFKDLKS